MALEDRKAVVVGAGGAIGGAIAQALAEDGCDVALVSLHSAADVAAVVERAGRRAVDLPTDITDAGQVKAAMERAEAELGAIDILVNAAGVTSFGAAAGLAEAEWDRVMAINLKGVFLCCQAAIPALRRRGSGRIVNIGSMLAKNGGNPRPWIDPSEQDRAGNLAYGVSKAGVHAMTAYLARELAAQRITVNTVAPGPIATPMTTRFPDSLKALIPVGRMGTPEEVAAAVVFLAGERAAFITGEILDVNGGAWAD